ncbi:MAG: hypothetical protein JWR02_1443 [Mucilaginibacter sp.]|nr:hypothetical protein [Mucilaginibacter sp.]
MDYSKQKNQPGQSTHAQNRNFNRNTSRTKTSKQPAKEYDLFTGGGTHAPEINKDATDIKPAEGTKTSDFTIFYNIAFENAEKVKKLMNDKTSAQQNAFWAEYLWKAHFLSKNSNGYEITDKDEKVIPQLLRKVEELRNYHSHIWHDNVVLVFTDELKEFVEQKYNEALAQLFIDYPGAVSDYEYLNQKTYKNKFNLFNEVRIDGKIKHFITREGRIFFLSFFLTTGQMNQFLQQRTGYKRADMPQFKIKRLLYTFYCNRDGAAITDFNHEERFIDTLAPEVRENVFKARTAFKLISYLMDYPDYWGSKDAMPLFDESGELIKNVEQLKQYIESRKLLAGLRFKLIDRTIPESLEQEDDAEKLRKEQEDKYRTGTIAFTHDDVPGYSFHINFESLHRLVLLQTLQKSIINEQPPLAILTDILKKHVNNRAMLYEILTKPVSVRTEKDQDYLLTKENQHLRGGRKLTEIGIAFFEAIEKGNPEKDIVLLANYLRPGNVKWVPIIDKYFNEKPEVEPEPIQVYQQDFVLGTVQKFRAGNRFVFYTAKYLMDFGGDDWYWGMERFPQVNEEGEKGLVKMKTYFKASAIPLEDDYRLTLEDGHIYLAIPKNENGKANHEKFYQFALGPNAMRYLAVYIHKNETGYAAKFDQFLRSLADDLEKLKENGHFDEQAGYSILEKPFVASFLKPAFNAPDKLRQLVKNRIAFIKKEWEHALANRQYLSRSAKNKLVMNAYRLFDWTNEAADGKFFRANEYNQMSVCHYSLHLKSTLPGKQITFDYLFEKLFELKTRKPPIPSEIKELLNDAKSLDHLMELVFNDRQLFFDNLLSLPSQLLKKEFPALCRKVGVSIPADFLKPAELEELKDKHQKTLDVQAFSIHPMLIVKHFFRDEYDAGKILSTVTREDGTTFKQRPVLNLFSDLRKNKQLGNVLHQDFYRTEMVENLYPAENQKKQVNALKGLINTTHTEDILLWWMAQRYLENNDFTKNIGEIIKAGRNIQLDNMNALSISLPLVNGGAEDALKESLYTEVLMHQLDDMMFMTEKSRLRKAAVHFKKRCSTEYQLWESDLKTLSENQFDGKELPDGTKGKPIPFQLLRNELDLVRRTGQKLADYMLAFEKNVLQKALDIRHDDDKNKFQAWLKAGFDKRPGMKADDKYHFNFAAVLNLAGQLAEVNAEVLSDYRNITFHDDVPITGMGSFSWLTRKGESIRDLLQITEDLHAKKDRTAWLPGGDKHKL